MAGPRRFWPRFPVEELPDLARLGAGTVLTGVLALAFQLLAARRLPAAEFATFGSALGLIYLGSTLSNPAMAAVTQLFVEAVATGKGGGLRALLLTAWTRAGAWAALLVLGAWAASAPLAALGGWHDPRAVVATAAAVGSLLVLAPLRGALRGLAQLRSFNRSLLLEASARALLGAALFTVAQTASAAILAYTLAALLAAAVARVELKLPPASFDVELGSRLRGVATGFLGVQFVIAGFHNIDMLLVRRLASTADAASYAGALSIARTIGFLAMPFLILILPRAAQAEQRGESALRTGWKLALLFVCVAAPWAALCLLIPEAVCSVLLGPGYPEAASLLRRLGPAFLLGSVHALLALALAVRRRFGVLTIYAALLALQVVGLSFHRGGIGGFADLVLLSHVAALALFAVVSLRERRSLPPG